MTAESTLDDSQRAFLAECRSATLATISPGGRPRLVPICFVLRDDTAHDPRTVLYSPLDEKPKQVDDVREMARVRDIRARPSVALLFDRWSEDWDHLAWLRASGTATLMQPGDDMETHRAMVAALRDKYPQYHAQHIETAPMIRVAIDEVVSWSAARERDPV